MSGTWKFALLTGSLALAAAIAAAILSNQAAPNRFEAVLLLIGAFLIAPFALSSYLACKYQWLSLNVSPKRVFLSALPLILSPIAFLLGVVGWGDIQEHWIRGLLHLSRRQLPEKYVSFFILAWIVGFGAFAVGFLLWISISALTRLWKLKTLMVICGADLILASALWVGLIWLRERTYVLLAFACFVSFSAGVLLALAIKMNLAERARTTSFRVALIATLLAVSTVIITLAVNTTPEKQLPYLSLAPLWTADIAQYGCRPDFGPYADLQSSQISFAGNKTLGIAMTTKSTNLSSNKWDYQDCIITIDATTGNKIGQLAIKGYLPHISGNLDGTFQVSSDSMTAVYDQNLRELPSGAPLMTPKNATRETAAHTGAFRSDLNGNLWFTRNGKEELLFKFPCGGVFVYTLSETRVLAIACGDFYLFDTLGKEVMRDGFVREGLKYAGRSSDRRYFLLTAYLWGFGDPSYLEEETTLICDTETGKIVVALKSDPLPSQQSWMDLSPDSSLLAIGAKDKLRVYKLSLPD